MRTITVMSSKGGTGKTTATVSLAIAAYLRGLQVEVVDVDPQRSAVLTLRNRKGNGPLITEASGGKVHQIKFRAEVEGTDLLLIDTPGTADANTLHAIHAADMCLLVTRPNYFDLAAAVTSAQTVRQLSKSGLVLINQAPCPRAGVEAPVVRSAREALAFTKLGVAKTTLRSRAVYGTALAEGLSPEEGDASAPAAVEIDLLWRELAARIGVGDGVEASVG